jgi:hypothetical protein
MFSGGEPMDSALVVEGITRKFMFHPGRVAENREQIGALLAELPIEFQGRGGGGWSFLNACNDKDGIQWTDLHSDMEELFCLGIAADKARWMIPKKFWSTLPGGMPYVVVN